MKCIVLVVVVVVSNYKYNYLIIPPIICGLSTFSVSFLGTSHCANMYPPASSDLPELTQARTTIRSYLREWLAENDFVDSAQYT